MTPAPDRPRPRSRFRRRVAAALPLVLLPLAGCGIQGSDVVEAGAGAPVTVHPTGNPRMLLFFVARDGRLMPVARDVGFGLPQGEADGGPGAEISHPPGMNYRVATDKVLASLIEGPDERERTAGLTSSLTFHGSGEPHTQKTSGPDGRPELHVRLAVRVQDLDPVALRQLACTAAYAEELGSAAKVVVSGTDGALPGRRCETD
ncbi:hypothetical protein AB0A05_16330 [Streptomyces sp. NPDC046374]|uniref:hypothetical protein n=1 Tax=unclassified Streptomyces TaxID=2593676 RepID=UPI0033EDEEF6